MSTEGKPIEPEPQSPFVVDGVDHRIVEKFQPQYLDHGGEHIVYTIPDHPEVVAKVVSESLRRIIRANVEQGNPPDHLSEEMKVRAQEYLRRETERFQRLRQYFGKEHVLGQRKALLKVPVTPQILDQLFDGNPPASAAEAWAMVAIQRKSDILNDPDRLSAVAGYAEQAEVDVDAYQRQTDQLVRYPKEPGFNKDEFLAVQQNQPLQQFVARIDADPELAAAARDFIGRSITYTSATGETLDLAGRDNVVFYRREGKWNYELPDALYPGEFNMIAWMQEATRKLAAGQEINNSDRNVLMNGFNYLRTVNGLAKYLGLEERIDIVPEEAQGAEIDYLTEIRRASQ